jgi:hypothetical protein
MDEILRALRAVADHEYLIASERSQAEDLWRDLRNAIEDHMEIG